MSERPQMRGGRYRNAKARLMAENAALAEQLRRLGPALTSMVHDLATARRELAALRRENLRLQALLAAAPREDERVG